MPISSSKKEKIKDLLSQTLDKKLEKYSRETTVMPFLVKLMQNADRVAAYSFVHSLVTTLGMSIYEKVSEIMVQGLAKEAHTRFDMGGVISAQQKGVITNIIEELREKGSSRSPNAAAEKREVMEAPTDGASPQIDGKIADFYYLTTDGIKRYFEIKTAKPNIDVFVASKRKILEWIARRREEDMEVFLALPYNPYHPEPYSRFTQQNLFQIEKDFLVAEQYWDLLSGESGTLESLLAIFDQMGKEYKEKIDEKIKDVSRNKQNIL